MTHVERGEIGEWLASQGFAPVGPDQLRELLAGSDGA
jgi:hypothetical protein